jgi:DNA-directed RNA polymerase specialized sigma24 family protein
MDESEDVASELVMTFIARWPKYDSQRASAQTFASRLMDKELMSILRYRMAQCRQVRELPMPDVGPTPESIHQFRIDLDRAMDTMPDVFRETAAALSQLSAVDAADAVGCSRQTINRRKHDIRDALTAAGIGSDYFIQGGEITKYGK